MIRGEDGVMNPDQFTDQPGDDLPQLRGADQAEPDAAQHSGWQGKVIPFPAPVDGQGHPVVERDLECVRRPMPVVLPPWLRSRVIALGTLRWAAEYAGRHAAFHAWRAPAYRLALS